MARKMEATWFLEILEGVGLKVLVVSRNPEPKALNSKP